MGEGRGGIEHQMIEHLTASSSPEISRIGGKGVGLVRLMRAGFRVPDVWCIPADIDIEEGPEAFDAELDELLRMQDGRALAVRSSATAEDLAEASFAGVYTTVLGVRGLDALRAAVRSCRASLHSEAARAYRDERGLGTSTASPNQDSPQPELEVRMAVLIQRLVRPDVAGVMLTVNPQRAFASEIAIDAAYGLGEGVVSGRVDADHLVLDRSTGEVREQRIGGKAIALRHSSGGGLAEEPVALDERPLLCLGVAEQRALFELAAQVRERLGPRMDLEWAFEDGVLHLLQARAITGLPPEEPEEVWSRKFGDEYMADYTTPSGYTFMVRWIREYSFTDSARMLGRDDLLAMEPLRRHHGYIYMSGRYAAAGARALPAGSRAGALRGWFPPLFDKHVQSQPFSPLLLVKTLLLPLRDPRGSMSKNLTALATHADRVLREIVPRLASNHSLLSDLELRAQLDEIDEIGLDHFRVIRWGMGQYAPALHAALQNVLESWVADASGELYQGIVSGLPGTHTAEINHDIWRLGMLAREDPALCDGLRERRPEQDLRAASPDSPFWPAFAQFMDRHGHRSTTRDISQPRWRETPDVVLSLVRAQGVGAEAPRDPSELERAAVLRREETEAAAIAALGRGMTAAIRRRALRWLFEKTQVFTVYRENQRYYLDVILAHLRNLVLEHGRRLAERGVLSEAWDAFLLEEAELCDALRSSVRNEALRSSVEERRIHYLKWRSRLPATYLFDDVETEGEIAEGDPALGEQGGHQVDGLGASRGQARGPLRVVSDVAALDQIEPGDILVARNIDPGWTSVFPLLGGLVTETGGLLSHGALLAREYGIPAIMGVPEATTRFQTGQEAVIDGARGLIEIEDIRRNS